MITSIQIHDNVKKQLDQLKETSKESYEEIIIKMIHAIEKQKREMKQLLKQGYEEMAEENLKMLKEWSAIDNELDWKWE